MSAQGEAIARLERAIATRDAFLARLAGHLALRVSALERASTPRAARDATRSLRDLASELTLIADADAHPALRPQRRDLAAWLERAVRARARGRPVTLAATRGAEVLGRWDTAALALALAELVSNAVKYGGAHPIAARVEPSRGEVRLVVENRGVFVGPARAPAPFHREETREAVPGFGLGLWLVERIARAHGGALRFEARRGRTRAIVALPWPGGARGKRTSVLVTPAERPPRPSQPPPTPPQR